MRRLYYWLRAKTTVLNTVKDAKNMKLDFVRNVYGKESLQLDCKSLWTDRYGNVYRCNRVKTHMSKK